MRLRRPCLLFFAMIAWLFPRFSLVDAEMQATWTPTEESDKDGSGPLPLSMQQRQELLKLEQAIRNSPDPQATLIQVAEANQMDPQDLVNTLNRNRQDLEQAGGAGAGATSRRGRNVWQSLVSVGVLGGQWTKRHPRLAASAGVALLLSAYTTWTIPRTGLVLSKRKSILSKGATTFFTPPLAYLEQALEDITDRGMSVSKKLHQKIADVLDSAQEDSSSSSHQKANRHSEPQWLDLSKTSTVKKAVTVSSAWHVSELRGMKFEQVEEEVVLESAWEQAVGLLRQGTLTEFCQPGGYLKFCKADKHGLLVVRGLGDWGGFGLVPLRIVSSLADDLDTTDSSVVLTLNTLDGAHWDGQIHIKFDLGSTHLQMRVTLLVPKGKSPPSRRVAQRLVQALHDSLAASLRTRTRQALARQSQSVRFQNAAREKASVRRQSRAAKERAIEEMAAERRRRWQRQNQNCGSYRPSGDRMRSPNNAVYH